MERISSVRRLMEKEGFDALLIHQPHNIYYMSGWSPKVTTRPILMIVPLEKETMLIYPEIEDTISHRYARRIQSFMPYTEEKYNLFEAATMTLKTAFTDSGMTKGRLGVEKGFLPVNYYLFLKENFPEVELVEADSIIWKMRMVKSEEEIELVKKACTAAEIGMELCLSAQAAGKTEIEVNAEVQCELTKKASELYPNNIVQVTGGVLSGYKTVDPHEIATVKQLKEGETVKNLIGGTVDGYYTALHRTTIVGTPTNIQKNMWETIVDAQRKGLELVKPGARVCDVHKRIREVIDEAGFGGLRSRSPHAHDQARSGSGQGLSYHEPPYLTTSNDTELVPNMIITVQPQINSPELRMGFGIGDTILITSEGHESLTKFRKDTI